MKPDTPALLSDVLASTIPLATWGGGPVTNPRDTLIIWRTIATTKARGATLAFYVWDERLEPLWTNAPHYADLFLTVGIHALVEVDFSLWLDAPIDEQRYNIYRMRSVSRQWQMSGLKIIPNLTWSDEFSFSFAFQGIPHHAPVVSTECRTAGQNTEDRRRFLAGLTAGVSTVQPETVVVYGGKEHAWWLESRLPPGPHYVLLPSWQTERERWRKQQAHKHQLPLFAPEVTA